MFILHVDLTAKAGLSDALMATYRDVFCPAIAKQPGFLETKLLRSKPPMARTHRLVIVFEKEELQKQWVATDLHQEAWKELKGNIAKVCSVDFFDIN